MSIFPEKEFSIEATTRKAARFLSDAGRRVTQAALTIALAAPAVFGFAASAAAEDKALKLFFTHTGEKAIITFKRDGRFDPKGLAQINRFLRDWRKNEPARMDPRLLDLVWEAYNRAGGRDYIHVVSAYRSPSTNNMLRSRSRVTGVAKNSQHMLGKAMDFYIPGVKLSTLRAIAMQMQGGGVGYYPTSGSPFVHLDVGNVRAWPRMSRQELAQIFPNGRTMHLPSNGGTLPGYDQAVADYRKRSGRAPIQIASVENDDDATTRSQPPRGAVSALLPTPRSQAREAFALHANPNRAVDQSPLAQRLASAVPVPMLKPVMAEPAAIDLVETASIAPVSAVPQFRERPAAPDFGWHQPQYGVKSTLHAPEMIAFLPMARSQNVAGGVGAMSFKALRRWALHRPGDTFGLKAPRFGRTHQNAIDAEASPAGDRFNDSRFGFPSEG